MLIIFSLAFYGWGEPIWISLLILSSLVDWGNSIFIEKHRGTKWAKIGVTFTVVFNLALLATFKYDQFIVDQVNALLGTSFSAPGYALPLGISFYTFHTISYVVDVYRGDIKAQRNFPNFLMYVSLFSSLVAGPIIRYAHVEKEIYGRKESFTDFSLGVTRFCIGLFKKVVIANIAAELVRKYMGDHSDPLTFTELASLSSWEAWFGLLMFGIQIYFDFSGYSDMAIGLSWMFNIRLPYNFNSPYKSLNISEFWKRWHMTLSAFLRDYLYIPLGGNREGSIRRYINLMTTMILGGLWHGANWTFVFWGTLHGAFLVINHAFQQCSIGQLTTLRQTTFFKILAWALTFFCTLFAWIFFRSTDFSTAIRIVSALVPDLNDSIYSVHLIFWNQGLDVERGAFWILLLGVIAFLMPNSNKFGELVLSKCQNKTIFVPLSAGFAVMSCLFLVLVNSSRDTSSAFIYFNF